MNDAQKKEIREAPSTYRGYLERAYSGQSRADGVRAMCLRCVGYLRDEVKHCSSYACPLHPYRPYQNNSDE
jgi:hypothetical protein